MKKMFGMLIAMTAFILLIGQPASAYLIDFEDLYSIYQETGRTGGKMPAGYAGFTWSTLNAFWTIDQTFPGTGYEFGIKGNVGMFTAAGNKISMSGEAFHLGGAYVTSAWNYDQAFTVQGWLNGTQVYSDTFTTDYTGENCFTFNNSLVDKVLFIPGTAGTNAGLGGSGNYLVIDNIIINPVPEPTSMLLLGSGLIGLACLGRKNKKEEKL